MPGLTYKFIQCSTPHADRTFWSLQKVLDLQSSSLTKDPSVGFSFLIAMASGLRSSQLHAHTRQPAWSVLFLDGSKVPLTLSPHFQHVKKHSVNECLQVNPFLKIERELAQQQHLECIGLQT